MFTVARLLQTSKIAWKYSDNTSYIFFRNPHYIADYIVRLYYFIPPRLLQTSKIAWKDSDNTSFIFFRNPHYIADYIVRLYYFIPPFLYRFLSSFLSERHLYVNYAKAPSSLLAKRHQHSVTGKDNLALITDGFVDRKK